MVKLTGQVDLFTLIWHDFSQIKWNEPSLHYALISIVAAPLIWNILARLEYYTHILTKLALGNKKYGCYALAVWIFSFSIFRDYLVSAAMDVQPRSEHVLGSGLFLFGSLLLIISGSIFVVSSMWTLGVTGTYLGDYFGILMKERVVGFPFNILNDPMYDVNK